MGQQSLHEMEKPAVRLHSSHQYFIYVTAFLARYCHLLQVKKHWPTSGTFHKKKKLPAIGELLKKCHQLKTTSRLNRRTWRSRSHYNEVR